MASSAAGRKNPLTSTVTSSVSAPSFWVTNLGRNVVGSIGAVTAAVYFSGYTLFNSFLLYKYQEVVQLYKYGFPVPVPPDLLLRCQQTVRDMSLKLKNEDMTRFFYVFGFDMFHAGSTKFRFGSIIGLPRSFGYNTADDIDKQDILVENKNVEWGSEGGQMLQDALLLSERAQKFAIAREIVMADSLLPAVYGSIGAASIMNYTFTTRFLNDKLHGLARPKSFRYMIYSLVGTFAFGVWATATDLVTKYYENDADRKAGQINMDYARGGVEFYSKILERNMALRSLMGPSGEKRFTFYGNDVEFIRQKHVPYSMRKSNLENIASELSTLNSSSESLDES